MTGQNIEAHRPTHSMRRLGRYALVYVISGRGSYADASGRRGVATAGDAIIVFPDLPHIYRPSPVWSEQYIVFDGPIFRVWEQAGILDPSRPIVTLAKSIHWVERLGWICAAGVPTNESAALRELIRLQEVLAEMFGIHPTWRSTSGEMWIEQVRLALEHPGRLNRKLDALSDAHGLSPATFRRRFRAMVGMSPGKYRMQSMIRHAQMLMLEGRMSDKQIAHELGFTDSSHFSHCFTRQVGVSPRQYRRSYAGDVRASDRRG